MDNSTEAENKKEINVGGLIYEGEGVWKYWYDSYDENEKYVGKVKLWLVPDALNSFISQFAAPKPVLLSKDHIRWVILKTPMPLHSSISIDEIKKYFDTLSEAIYDEFKKQGLKEDQ